DTDAGRTEHLVPGERREIHTESTEVDGHVRYRLACVEHDDRADLLRTPHDLLDGSDRTGHVRLVRERHDLHSLGQRQRIEVDAAVVGDAVPAQGGTRTPREFLPRSEIRVVLELGDDDLVTGSEPVR